MTKYICKTCDWQGQEDEVEYDEVESCMGNDKLEMCPKCGSINVFLIPEPYVKTHSN